VRTKRKYVVILWKTELSTDNKRRMQLFTQKKTKDGKSIAIHNEKMMEELAEGRYEDPTTKIKDVPSDQALRVVKYVREMIGTFIYMQEEDVAKILAKEKNRIGAMIDAIDQHLHKSPRQAESNDGTKKITYTPWQEQGLGDKWNRYMDDVFERAKQKGTDYVGSNLGNLEQEWNSQKEKGEFKIDAKDDAKKKDEKRSLEAIHKDITNLIDKMRKEWDKVKNWEKPKNW
jgi:uncharacterized FlaG/YvyC family protein